MSFAFAKWCGGIWTTTIKCGNNTRISVYVNVEHKWQKDFVVWWGFPLVLYLLSFSQFLWKKQFLTSIFFPLTSSKHFLSLNCICLWFLFGHLERFNVIGIKGLVLVTETFVLDVLNTETKQCKWSCEALTWKRKRKSIFVWILVSFGQCRSDLRGYLATVIKWWCNWKDLDKILWWLEICCQK